MPIELCRSGSSTLPCAGEGSAPLLHTWFVSGHGTSLPRARQVAGHGFIRAYHTLSTVILSVTERPEA